MKTAAPCPHLTKALSDLGAVEFTPTVPVTTGHFPALPPSWSLTKGILTDHEGHTRDTTDGLRVNRLFVATVLENYGHLEFARSWNGGVLPSAAHRPTGWQPIETAPRDNKRLLYLAKIVGGKIAELDTDGIWESDSESWEMPQPYYYWASARGIEEPTHWAYQDEGPPPCETSPAPTWQPITEAQKAIVSTNGLNQYGARYLLTPVNFGGVSRGVSPVAIGCWWSRTNSSMDNWIVDSGQAIFPTHFMPLPTTPQE